RDFRATRTVRSLRSSRHAPKSDVTHAGVDHLRLPRRRSVAQAVVRRAQMGAALDHLARNAKLRLGRIVTFFGRHDARIDRRAAAWLDDLVRVPGNIPVRGPLPDIA